MYPLLNYLIFRINDQQINLIAINNHLSGYQRKLGQNAEEDSRNRQNYETNAI